MAYTSPEKIVEDLKKLEGKDRLDLLEEIVEVAEKESYNWSMSVQDVIDWLRDVREKNNLYAIFFIWDEFTEYFKNNVNNITGLQEIAQNSAELRFYFFLITHSNLEQLIFDDKQRKIIMDRFKTAEIVLPESTALQLLAQALYIDSSLKDEWEKISRELWENVQRDAANFIIRRDESVRAEDMKKLLPIHPYAAYLLKFIAQENGSNQRTMFQFISANGENNFKNFIENRGFQFGGDNFLTTDFLWDYFFKDDNPDFGKNFSETVGHYNNFVSSCQNENQRRIFKATLILFSLQQKSISDRKGGVTSLLRSTRKNIVACFAGTYLENEVQQTLNYFTDRGIISAVQESDDTLYIMASTQIDPERMEESVKQVERNKPFDMLIKDDSSGIAKKFKPTDYLQYRIDIQIISPTKFLQTSLNFRLEDNKILAFYIFARDEEEQGKVNQVIQRIHEKFHERCIIADFSSTPFTKQRYEKFIKNKAQELYFKDVPNQAGQIKVAKQAAASLVEEWLRQLAVATIRVYSSAEESAQISGEINFLSKLRALNRKFFGGGIEEISTNDKLFPPSSLTDTVAKYAFSGERIKGSSSWLNAIGDVFSDLVRSSGEKYWRKNPSHIISKMKIVVENVIEDGFKSKNEVSLTDIWAELKKPPIGLTQCPAAIFIFTLLMKDYADKNFYVRDINNNTHVLTGERLCNLSVNVVKESSQVQDKCLVKQTPEHVEFCRITAQIFNLQKSKINSIDDAAKNIKIRLTQSHYPLWTLKYFVEENYFDDPDKEIYLRFLNLLEEFVNSRTERNVTKVADEIFSVYDKNPLGVEVLKNIVQDGNFKIGMTIYIAQNKPELKKIVGRLKLSDGEYLSRLNEKLSADSAYLWTIEDVDRQINNLFDELRLIEAINALLSSPQKKIFDAYRMLGEKLNQIRIPRAVVEEFQPDLKDLLQLISALLNKSEKNFAQAAEQIIQSADAFNQFFENQFEIFAQALMNYVDGTVDSKIVEKLFSDSPNGIFFKTRDDFVLQMKSRLQKFRQNEKINKFFAAWREVTGTTSPADWSKQNELPILCAFQDCLDAAQTYFSALNKTGSLSNETAMDAALKFIRGDKLSRLADKEFCNRAFVNYFCGENYSVVVNAENLRGILKRYAGNDVYSWFAKKKNCETQIKSFAEKNYRENFLSAVREKIHKLTAEDAQKYLEELIYKDTLLGIRVLKDS